MGHILEFLLVPNNYIKLGTVDVEPLWACYGVQEVTYRVWGFLERKKEQKGSTLCESIMQVPT